MRLIQDVVLLGGPGLLIGAALGVLVPKWKLLVALAVLGAVALLYGINHAPSCGNEDDCPAVLALIAMVTNFGGWLVGLALGATVARARRRV